uniref:PX domain-containing protein n=1 Tax=Strongyloides papillosus TaxID=174720 RepID=A0A0N5BVX5_STREA
MTYHFTLAVTKYSHTETSRKFSAFLSQIRDAFSIDGVTDENIKFPLLRSRLDDKTREMIPTTKPDETFEQYLIRLAAIFDDTLITNDLETQYSFFKLNFSSDKFEETLREFVQLHETIYRDLPAELNFQSFRRRLLDLLTPKPNLFKVILNSTATTNPTLVTTLVHFFKANGLLHKHSLDTCISTMDNYISTSLYTKQEHISSPNTFTVKNEVNNTSTTTVQSSPIIIRQTTMNNISSKTIMDADSNATYIDPTTKNKIILSSVPESINQIPSNGYLYATVPV